MFSRGNWAVLQINKEHLANFERNLANLEFMFLRSQLLAEATASWQKLTTYGVNPFVTPRLDERDAEDFPADSRARMVFVTGAVETNNAVKDALDDTEICLRFGVGADFRLLESTPLFGFWFVMNEWKDIGDANSLKEDLAYRNYERPYKFLESGPKKDVERIVNSRSTSIRKQFPVLIDFQHGRVFIESTSKDALGCVNHFLTAAEVETIPCAWKFDNNDWVREVLNRLYAQTLNLADYKERAEETTRFRPDEIAAKENRDLEKVLQTTFSMTQLSSDVSIGICAPAQIRLHKTSQPVLVKNNPNATLLLGLGSEENPTGIFSGSLTFQSLYTKVNKAGEESVIRTTLFTVGLSDNINDLDSGAAMLPGFDAPAFKKKILREIRKLKQTLDISQYWFRWLTELNGAIAYMTDAFTEVLELDPKTNGLLRLYEASGEEQPGAGQFTATYLGVDLALSTDEPAVSATTEEEPA